LIVWWIAPDRVWFDVLIAEVLSMLNMNRLKMHRLAQGALLGLSLSLPLVPLLGTQPVDAAAGALSIEINGLRNRNGQVCLSVFNSSNGFPTNGDNAVSSQCVAIDDPASVRVTFGGLKAGSYAVAILHDENADGKANRNRLGIPTEGFGFSRNPGLRAGPPSFADSAFLAAGSQTEIQVQMRYLF
jgi:uncharacterized protein (DUF2141 family)